MDGHDYVSPCKDPVSENDDSMSDIEVVPPMQGASRQPDILKGKSGKPKKKQKTWVTLLLHISCLAMLIQLSRLLWEVRSPKVRLM